MKKPDDPDYIYEIRSRGGVGRAALNEWSVYGPDRLAALESGEVKGAYSRAKQAGREAVERWETKAKARKV